jgi:hypothetical protein
MTSPATTAASTVASASTTPLTVTRSASTTATAAASPSVARGKTLAVLRRAISAQQ